MICEHLKAESPNVLLFLFAVLNKIVAIIFLLDLAVSLKLLIDRL